MTGVAEEETVATIGMIFRLWPPPLINASQSNFPAYSSTTGAIEAAYESGDNQRLTSKAHQ